MNHGGIAELMYGLSLAVVLFVCSVYGEDAGARRDPVMITAERTEGRFNLERLLRDVAHQYGIQYVGVFSDPFDWYHLIKRRPAFSVTNQSPAEFFASLQAACPDYTFTLNTETGVWLVGPSDGSGSNLLAAVKTASPGALTPSRAVARAMRGIKRSCELNPGSYLGVIWEGQDAVTNWWDGTNRVGYPALAYIISKMPRSFMQIHVVTNYVANAPYERLVPSEESWPLGEGTNICWALGSSLDYHQMSDEEVIEIMRRKCREEAPLGVIWLQLVNMDDQRLWRIYEKLDWYDDSPSIVMVFGDVFNHPTKRYGDTAIRFAIHNVHRLRDPITPMQILLFNCYSKDVQRLLTTLIESETPFWKSRVYSWMLEAPRSIPDDVYTKWFELLQDGVRYDAERSSLSPPNSASWSNMVNYYMSTNRTITSNVKRRLNNEELMRADLEKYNVDTNRALTWVLTASSHIDDTGWTYGDTSPSARPLSEQTNRLGRIGADKSRESTSNSVDRVKHDSGNQRTVSP